jgi:hypothetical protein
MIIYYWVINYKTQNIAFAKLKAKDLKAFDVKFWYNQK